MRHTRIALIAVVLAACTAAVSSGLASAATKVGRITQFNLPPPHGPYDITVGPDGNMWFTIITGCCDPPKFDIGMMTPSGQFSGFYTPTPNPGATSIVAGSDGNLWFDEFFVNQIGVITPQGAVTEYPIPPLQTSSGPETVSSQFLTRGPDGAIWFTGTARGAQTQSTGLIGRVDVNGGFTEIPLPSPQSNPEVITAGPDGALWFSDLGTTSIGRMTTAGAFTNSFPEPQPPGTLAEVFGIAFGPDGNLWFSDADLSTINRMTMTGKVTTFPLSNNPIPTDIKAGPDGAMWFPEGNFGAPGLGRITMQGKVTEFTTPTADGGQGVSAGPPGKAHTVWFTQPQANNIDVITTR